MAGLVASALAGVVFGLALAAPPGPMNAIIAEESVVRGWTSGVAAGLGAMTADATFFVLTLLGVVGIVEAVPTLRGAMVGVGGLLMLYFAYGAARDASATFTAEETTDGDKSTGFRKAFVLALTNPYQVVFWLTVGVGMLRPGELDVLSYTPYVGESLSGVLVVATGSPALIAGFFAGIGVWVLSFPAVLLALGRRVDRFSTGVAVASAAVLAGFGLLFLADAAGTLA
ncbi:lysine transporter LysE [Halobacteriales archaeon QS_1_68_20]|nr:MAG: lysine transporter LysE [Halobacteriales archaeon QS_1_68_20]